MSLKFKKDYWIPTTVGASHALECTSKNRPCDEAVSAKASEKPTQNLANMQGVCGHMPEPCIGSLVAAIRVHLRFGALT